MMTHDEIVTLIRGGVMEGIWAELGAGNGNFTRALRQLLRVEGTIYAVDKDAKALEQLHKNPGGLGELHLITADFTRPLDLPPLDGILMANALHFVRDQIGMLALLAGYLRPNGRLLLVEYDVIQPLGYIPYPVPFRHFESLAASAGFSQPERVSERKSPSSGITMYAAFSRK